MSELFQRVMDAHAAMQTPAGINSAHVMNCAVTTAVAFFILGTFDFLVARRFHRSYMALHFFANVIITFLTLPSAVRALWHPTESSVVPAGSAMPPTLYLSWVYAIHLYHPCARWIEPTTSEGCIDR